MSNDRKLKIFLATGGSGGHIFPAISVAEKLTDADNNICIVADSIYKKYSSNNLNYRIIDAGKNIKSISHILSIIKGFLQAKKLIKQEKPDLVIGFGSYATLPTLMACYYTQTPFILHEQNAYIGKINKLFAKYAQRIMTSYYEMYGINFNDMEKVIYTGLPIRKELKYLANLKYVLPKNDEKFIILITGGSSGAKIFSEYLPKIFDEEHRDIQKHIKVYHQVKEEYLDIVKDYYKKINLDAKVSTFFDNMGELLSKAHLVIGRSGSNTLFETALAGKPSIVIPLINSANNHQEINAKVFKKNNATIMVLEKDFNIQDFQKIVFDLIKNKDRLLDLSMNIKKLSLVNADENILKIIKEVEKYGRC